MGLDGITSMKHSDPVWITRIPCGSLGSRVEHSDPGLETRIPRGTLGSHVEHSDPGLETRILGSEGERSRFACGSNSMPVANWIEGGDES